MVCGNAGSKVSAIFMTVQQVIAIRGMLRMTYKDVVQFRIVKWVNGYTATDNYSGTVPIYFKKA